MLLQGPLRTSLGQIVHRPGREDLLELFQKLEPHVAPRLGVDEGHKQGLAVVACQAHLEQITMITEQQLNFNDDDDAEDGPATYAAKALPTSKAMPLVRMSIHRLIIHFHVPKLPTTSASAAVLSYLV